MAVPAESKPVFLLGVRYSERKDNSPPGLEWVDIKDGATLGTIADGYRVRWIDLALYNFHTIDLAEINWYLHHFYGCTKNNGKTYSFSRADKLHKILVPTMPPSMKKGPPRSVAVVRDGKAQLDNKLQVYCMEWVAGGVRREISGKWLYVFSGTGGLDFGYDPPPGPPPVDGPVFAQPGTAFTLDFPGVFPIKEAPNKLEYEILITSNSAPSSALMTAVSGKKDAGQPYYKPGPNWYFLSDPTILGKALSESRDKRNTHAFRNTKLVTIDLASNKRYYFLLSPVQLGPEALKFAMANPKGLTPLLKPGENAAQWDPGSSSGPVLDQYRAPSADDYLGGLIVLPVIDPYAWAEDIAESVYRTFLEEYVKWLGLSGKGGVKNETIAGLTHDTGWTLDHLYVAQILKTVRDQHPKPGSIDDELEDAAKFKSDLDRWEKDLVKRNAEINANAHRSLLELTEWLQKPGHQIIETAILKDTTADSPQDAIDVARGILHWSVCTDNMIALLPGVDFLRGLLKQTGTVPTDIVLKQLDPSVTAVTLSKTHEKAFKYASQGVLRLLALRDFVSPPPKIAPGVSRQDYLMNLGKFQSSRAAALAKMLNDSKILAAKVQPVNLTLGGPQTNTVMVAATASNSMLDAVDKWTTYVIDPDIEIPRKFGLNWMANLEEWFEKRPTFAKIANIGTSWTLKGVSLVLNGYNLYQVVTTARYDYQTNQLNVRPVDYVQAVSGATLAVQDVLAEIASLSKNQVMMRTFPQLMTTSGGPSWGVGAARVTGIAGTTFAAVNALAMIVAGVATVVSMERAHGKAIARGDYTAAKFYVVGMVGGAMMAGGGLAFGIALIEAGGAVSATGIGATIGVVLFLVGGIIATIASVFGWWASSDDYQVFARKCFLGKQSHKEPRFGDDPPAWSNAASEGSDTWPILKQKRAIHNLLGQFTVKTTPSPHPTGKRFDGQIKFLVKPGLFMAGSTLQVALSYGKHGQQTSVTVVWEPDADDSHRIVGRQDGKGALFTPDLTITSFSFQPKAEAPTDINVTLSGLAYDASNGELSTTVSVRYPQLENVIVAKKMVMKAKGDGLKFDDNEVTSAIFE